MALHTVLEYIHAPSLFQTPSSHTWTHTSSHAPHMYSHVYQHLTHSDEPGVVYTFLSISTVRWSTL